MTESSKTLKLQALEVEADLGFTEVVALLKAGKRMILVCEDLVAEELTARQLRGLGALVKVCGSYGASVMFSPQRSLSIFDCRLNVA